MRQLQDFSIENLRNSLNLHCVLVLLVFVSGDREDSQSLDIKGLPYLLL